MNVPKKKFSLGVYFFLEEKLDCPKRREEMRRVQLLLPKEGINTKIVICSGDHTDLDVPDIEENIILYLADSNALFQNLVKKGKPAVGYLHPGNQGETFTHARYLVEEPQWVDVDSYEKMAQRLSGLPWTIATTNRLLIRELVKEDLDSLYELYEDAEAQRFLTPLSSDRKKEEEILCAYIDRIYSLYGYGMWAVCEKDSGKLIGKAGFQPGTAESRIPEYGCLILAEKRKQGISLEAGEKILQFADEKLGFPITCAMADIENEASIRMLQHLGFHETGNENKKETNRKYFIRMRKGKTV